MRVLAITNPGPDYLADAFLIGARRHLGDALVECPPKDILYAGAELGGVRGAGFTLYGVLPQGAQVARDDIDTAQVRTFDLVVFTSVWRQYDTFLRLLPGLDPARTVFLDGEDHETIFGYGGRLSRRLGFWRQPRPHRHGLYFKRELTPRTLRALYYKLVPTAIAGRLPRPRGLREIGFGIPAEKIVDELPAKVKDFPVHVVDAELAGRLPGAGTSYAFDDEGAYYADLRASRFGITTRRGGWDCLRHYEIAAAGAVVCFRNLDRKPATCAPHGLVPGQNCLSYRDADDLLGQVGRLSAKQYATLQVGGLAWVREWTCERVAGRVSDAALSPVADRDS